MNQAFIALGTNIEPRIEHLDEALDLLAQSEGIKIGEMSSIYETAPVGYTDQADFLNMVIQIETSHSSIDLLNVCQRIEQQLGRKRGVRFGPRTIDLDILVYNQENRKTDHLTIPHPRMHERAFVLIPFAEIAPSFMIEAIGQRVSDMTWSLSNEAKEDVVKWTLRQSAKD